MTYILGLTGSIGMGKSTTADFFREFGVPVWDADATVHKLYQGNQNLMSDLHAIASSAISAGKVDRKLLSGLIKNDPDLLPKVEAIVHPYVAKDRAEFIKQNANAPLIVLDIPLIFETGQSDHFDGVFVVTASISEQRKRVLAREGMTEEKFEIILSRQTPDAEKRERADFVIETKSLEYVRDQVQDLIKQITGN